MWVLPPRPTIKAVKLFGFKSKEYHEDLAKRRQLKCPKKSTLLAVQGRNAGVFCRFLAYCIDRGLMIGSAFLGILVVTALVQLIPEDSVPSQAIDTISQIGVPLNQTMANTTAQEANDWLTEQQQTQHNEETERLLFGVALPVFVVNMLAFIIDAISMAATGRTVGKAIMGLVVVNSHNGKVGHIGVWQSFCRSLLTNVFPMMVWIATPFSLIREDRRSLIDIFCSTTVIYAWDAKSFRMASEEMRKEAPYGDLDFESLHFDDEESIEDSERHSLTRSVAKESNKNPHRRSKSVSRVLAGNDYEA